MSETLAVSSIHVAAPPRSAPTVETPVLHLDTAAVVRSYEELASALPGVRLHYAVKANPAHPVLSMLAAHGAAWDVASPGEVTQVMRAGGLPADMSYGNTVKREDDIAWAHGVGVRCFTLDSQAELAKLVRRAPGATLLVRLATSGAGADWALGHKFGCSEREASLLLAQAVAAGHPVGVAFHVGSQQRDPHAWRGPLAATGRLRQGLRAFGADLAVVDLGGGFPAAMLGDVPELPEYAAALDSALSDAFGDDQPTLMAEPGRAVVADAGVLETEVLLVADREDARWVYLDIGVFGGLAEALDEGLKYRIEVLRGRSLLRGPTREVVLAGPTCDSADVLYRRHRYRLPVDLRPGDRLLLLSAGAYTTTYASVGFNGFAPLRTAYR
jgi:ornithine decarboxylase